MFRKTYLMLLFVLCFAAAFAQPAKTIFSIDGKNICARELVREYQDWLSVNDTIGLHLMVPDYADYRLMVTDALHHGIDTTAYYRRALEYYRNYLLLEHVGQSKALKNDLKSIIDHSAYQYRVSYIRIDIYANSGGDTSRAYSKACQARDRVNSGKQFEDVAMSFSDDPNVKFNRGNLGWVSPIEFECGSPVAQYIYDHATAQRQVSAPIRSGDSYFVVKVDGRRQAVASVNVSPILVRKKLSWRFNDSVRSLFADIDKRIKTGEDFQKLQEKYSDLKFSETISMAQALRKYSARALEMDADGKCSNIVETPEFFCILRQNSSTPLSVDALYKADLANRIMQSQMFRAKYESFLDSVRTVSQYKKVGGYNLIVKMMPDSSIFEARWEPGNLGYLRDDLLQFGGEKYTLADFAKYIYDTQYSSGYCKITEYVAKRYDEYVDMLTYKLALKLLEKADRHFTDELGYFATLSAYEAYMAMNDIAAEARDTNKVYDFYRHSKLHKFTSHELYISFYDYKTDQNRKKVQKLASQLAENPRYPLDEALISRMSADTFSLGQNILADKVINGFNNGTFSDKNSPVVFLDDDHVLAIVKVVARPREYTKAEVFPQMSVLMAQELRSRYVKQLRSKYNLVVAPDALETLANCFN